jgi:hypothetical protein
MTRSFMAQARAFPKLALLVAALGLAAVAGMAQPTSPASGVLAPPTPPTPPPPKAPTELLRQLLAALPAGREQMLASRPERSREIIRQALREFDSLPAGTRRACGVKSGRIAPRRPSSSPPGSRRRRLRA